jgi:hypothetical protein
MKFSADLYLTISDRIIEKAMRQSDIEVMGKLLTRANLLVHRARHLEPATSQMLSQTEMDRLRRHARAGQEFARKSFARRGPLSN